MKRTFFRVAVALSLSAISLTAAAAHPATGVVFDGHRRTVYFSDLETVWKVDAAGRLSIFRAAPGGRHTHELGIDQGGNVYGGDISYTGGRWFSAFWRMTPAGELTYLLPPTEGFAPGWGVHRDSAGNVYSVEQDNNRRRETLLLRRTPEGRTERVAGGAYGHADGRRAAARLASVGGIAVLEDGTVFLTDGPHLRRVTADGTVTTIARNLPASDPQTRLVAGRAGGSLFGLAADGSGSVYVADFDNRRVLRVGPDGKVVTVLRADKPWSPTGVALGNDGAIYVLEVSPAPADGVNGSRVRRVTPDGGARIVAPAATRGQAASGRAATHSQPLPQLEQLASSDRGARLYLALALISIGLVSLAVHLARRGKS